MLSGVCLSTAEDWQLPVGRRHFQARINPQSHRDNAKGGGCSTSRSSSRLLTRGPAVVIDYHRQPSVWLPPSVYMATSLSGTAILRRLHARIRDD